MTENFEYTLTGNRESYRIETEGRVPQRYEEISHLVMELGKDFMSQGNDGIEVKVKITVKE